jgi:probable ATP-dependent RNA helicase DDX4
VDILVATPGRLLDHVSQNTVDLSSLEILVLDEADRMLDMGFEGDVRKMVEQMGMPGKTERQTLMFSATFPEEIQRLARDFLNNYLFVTVGRVGGANMDIDQNVYEVDQFGKRDKLVSILNETGQDRTLVFVEQKRNADFLASYLSQSEFPTTSIHGDRLQREREEALRDFKRGRAPILVATSVAARGLDIPNVMHVINYDLPSSIEEYVHRIGRTARCGNTGKATSFFDPQNDGPLARSLVKVLQDAQQEVPRFLEEAAEQSFGQGFSGAGGRFGGRDTRRGKVDAINAERVDILHESVQMQKVEEEEEVMEKRRSGRFMYHHHPQKGRKNSFRHFKKESILTNTMKSPWNVQVMVHPKEEYRVLRKQSCSLHF